MESNRIYYIKAIGLGATLSAISYFALLAFSLGKLSILSGIFFVVPVAIAIYSRFSLLSELEDDFRQFLEDLRDILQSGVGITSGLEVLARGNYGRLTPFIRKLTTQVRLGIPFEKALTQIFHGISSPMINKMVLVISETHKAGGDIIKIFGTSTEYVAKIERLKTERRTRTMSTTFSAYLMFFIFVLIIIGIQVFFVPIMNVQTNIGEGPVEKPPQIDFSAYFLYLIIVQSVFAGPMIGKISENNVLSGLKHSVILLTVSAAVYVVAIQLFLPGK
ncbi:MAG: type II secretion system F family protein [archaeon]